MRNSAGRSHPMRGGPEGGAAVNTDGLLVDTGA
jgi:hypothetical protein